MSKEITNKFDTKTTKVSEEFETGSKRGSRVGKGRFDLITPFLAPRLAGIYERGATIYGERNWEKGQPLSRFLDSAERHLNQFKRGLRDEDHLGQCIWNLACIVHFEEIRRTDLFDLPYYPDPNALKVEVSVDDMSDKELRAFLKGVNLVGIRIPDDETVRPPKKNSRKKSR